MRIPEGISNAQLTQGVLLDLDPTVRDQGHGTASTDWYNTTLGVKTG